MKTTTLERWLVNRPVRGRANMARVDQALARLGHTQLADALEVGCGTGAVTAQLHERYGLHAVGLDLDPAQIAQARRRHPQSARLRFVTGDVTRMHFPEACFDLVVAQNTFHHIPRWDLALAEVSRVLRPGGLLVWQDFAVRAALRGALRPLERCAGVYTLAEIRRQLANRGIQQRVHQRLNAGPLTRHHLVLRKLGVDAMLPSLNFTPA